MVLTLDQWDLSPTSSPTALIGRYGSQGASGPMGASGTGSRDWPPPFLPSSSSSSPAAAMTQPPQPATQSPSPSPSQTPTPSPSHGPPNASHGSPSVGQTSGCAATNPQSQGSGHRLGSKPSSLGLGGGGDRRNGSPCSGKAGAQQQAVTGTNSSSNSGNSSTNGSRTNGGVTLYPYQVRECVCVFVCV